MTTFHVIYVGGTTARLLPLAFSLLRAPGARFVLVDNDGAPEESRQLRCVADSEPRFSYYRLPFAGTVRHGAALDHLLERGSEPTFAILDSDVLASGDFLADLARPPAGWGALCTGWPVWIEDGEAVCDDDQPFAGGPYRVLRDGTAIGGTSCTVYDRGALRAALRGVPRGLANQTAVDLDAPTLAAFRARGWRFTRFGTARVAHLRLVLQSRPVINRDSAHLHHIGGVSHAGDGAGRTLRRAAQTMLRGPRTPIANLVANVVRRLGRRGRARSRTYRRKDAVVAHVAALMEALRDGHAPPPPIPTGSAEVDRRLGALTRALIQDYPGHCERVRTLAGT